MTPDEKRSDLREARDDVNRALDILEDQRNEPGVTTDQANQLAVQIGELRQVRDDLLLKSLDAQLARIEASANSLGDVADKIDKSSDQLKSIAMKIDTAAKVLGVAASIVARVAMA